MAEQPTQDQIDELMKQLSSPASAAPAARPPVPSRPSASRVELEPLTPTAAAPSVQSGLEFLSDVDVELRVELGSARLNVQEILKLGTGSVVGLENLVGDPVCVYVNDRLLARGEVLVVNDNFAVRITEVLALPKPEAAPPKALPS